MQKYSAMIVDDSVTDRYLLKRYLEKTEMIDIVFEAEDGRIALEMLIEHGENESEPLAGFPPTILFLDINMPRLGGFEFLEKYEELREKQKELSLVIMMFTSSANEEDKNKAFSFTCVKDYLEKGEFKAADIKEKILKHVKN